MANTARDLIKCKISNTPGTSSGFTLDSAVANFLMPASTDDTLQFKLNITESGVGTEIRKGCTYTHSSTSFSRGTMVRSTGTADAALDFTSAAIVSVVPSAEDFLTTEQAAAARALLNGGNGIALLGDSYFANAAGVVGGVRWYENAMSPVVALNTLLGGVWDVTTDTSVSGTTSDDWISDQLGTILAGSERFVFVAFPTNDPDLLVDGGGGIVATSIANLSSIYSQIKAAGKMLFLINGGNKNSWTAVERGYAHQISDWITSYAQENGVPLFDLMSAINDPATGIGSTTFICSDSGDYVHPNPAGYLYGAARSLPAFSSFTPRTINVTNKATQGIYNAAMSGDTSGFPEGWVTYTNGTPTTTSATKIARTDGPGSFVRLTGTSDASGSRLGMTTAAINFSTAWSTGTKALGTRVKGSFGDHWICTTAGTSSGSEPAAMASASSIGQQVTDSGGVVWTRYTNIVPGTSKLSFRLDFDMTSVSGGDTGAQPVFLLNFGGGTVPYAGIWANVISGVANEKAQRWGFTRSRRPVLVSPYQVLVPSGAGNYQIYLFQEWSAADVTSSFDIYGLEVIVS